MENCQREMYVPEKDFSGGEMSGRSVGHGGSWVGSLPFVRRVVGANPAQATMKGPSASPSLAVVCGASA